jgi:hypothetical protein
MSRPARGCAPHQPRRAAAWRAEVALLCLCRSFLQPRVRRDPVRLPGFASVVGERLLEVARVGSDVRDDESDEDGPAIERFLIEELSAPVLEFANRGFEIGWAARSFTVSLPLRLAVVA